MRIAEDAIVATTLDHLLGLSEGRAERDDRDEAAPEVELFGLGHEPEVDVRAERLPELVVLARKGDRTAFAELYRRLAPMVAATAQRTVSDPDAVADVVQETFARALERLDQLREPAAAPAWLAGIARRVATDTLRVRYRATSGFDEQVLDLVEDTAGPDSFAEQRLRLREVGLALGLLSRSDARMVYLVADLGLTTEELARVLGVSPTAAKVRLHRARRRLNQFLEHAKDDVIL
jgi:RNA polymerase sigma-70 factor (ECF subfamily)